LGNVPQNETYQQEKAQEHLNVQKKYAEGELTAEREATSKAEGMPVLGCLCRMRHLRLTSCRCAAKQLSLEREIAVWRVLGGEWMSERGQNEAAMKSSMQREPLWVRR
jgi:hypothetical protein